MDSEIERTIIHYYPQRALVSPLQSDVVRWDYDTSYATLKSILAELKTVDPLLRPGTRGRYDISEELVLCDVVNVQLCLLGPYVAVNHGVARSPDAWARDLGSSVEVAMRACGIEVLGDDVLQLPAPWIRFVGTTPRRPATVYECLFLHPKTEADAASWRPQRNHGVEE